MTGSQKAIAAFILTSIFGFITVFLANFPDDADVQLWGSVAAGIVTVLTTTFGVWQTANKPTG